jgi:aromatic ring hydroxylase-like protein
MGRLEAQASTTAIARPEFLNEMGMIFGASYDSAAVISDGTAPPILANPVTDYIASARPGGRAPHVWLERDGTRISTIDLFRSGFVLLAGAKGRAWLEAARHLPDDMRRGVEALLIGEGAIADPGRQWATAYEIDDNGAVLVRPDGYVAWRSRSLTADPTASLGAALNQIFDRG